MTLNEKSEYFPKDVRKEINFMLFNYKKLDKLIEKRKHELINKIDISSAGWYKSKSSLYSNTLEDVVLNFDEDESINKLSNWKIFLDKYIKELFNNKNEIFYKIINLKYIEKKDLMSILNELEISLEEFNYIDLKIKLDIFKKVKKENIIYLIRNVGK